MKEQSDKKSTWAIVLSIIAIVLCLLVFELWIFEVIPHSTITSETFIGACITLLSIIVTIAIGWQIFNVLEMRQIMQKLETKQEMLKETQLNTNANLNEIDKHALHMQHMMIAELCEVEHQYAKAIYYYLGALYNSIDLQVLPDNIDLIFERIPNCLEKLKVVTKIPAQMYDDIMNIDARIRAFKHFNMFKSQYIPLFEEFISKIEK